MAERFAGKVALITGAARGQGRALALRLASEGADVIAVDVCAPVPHLPYETATPGDLAGTVQAVHDLGRRIVAAEVDVRDGDGLQAAVRRGVDELGRVDLVAANAGVITYGRCWELTQQQWDTVLSVNVTGVWNTVRAVVPTMIEQGSGGAIVITSSVAGLKGLPLMGAYTASKHAVVGLARTLANELGEYRIRVNTVHPYGVRTGMTETDDTLHVALQGYPMLGPIFMAAMAGSPLEPDDVASVTAFLMSEEGRHITGVALPVDLGSLAR